MQVRDHFDAITGLGVEVLAISFARRELLEGFRSELGLPFPVATDPNRVVYQRYGLLKGSMWAIWHPRVIWKYIVMVARGARLQRSGEKEDLSQLGGDFVIGGDGTILFAHRSCRPDDRPDVATLMRAMAQETGTKSREP